MRYILSSLFVLTLCLTPLLAEEVTANFMSDNDCLQSNFNTSISHQAALWGALKNILKIEKKGCLISVFHESMRFSQKKWLIDVCREPIHIKYGVTSVEVFKKIVDCKNIKEAKKDSFCQQREELFDVVQDDGLIFADGEKEDITSAHGRTYCSLQLIKTYFDQGIIFSRMRSYENILFSTLPLIGNADKVLESNPKKVEGQATPSSN